MIDVKKKKSGKSGGYENFTDRGGFEEIHTTYDSETLRYFLDGAISLIKKIDMEGVKAVLDVGTGTGHLAVEMAKRYPHCQVVGADSSPGMLSQARKKIGNLTNLQFQQHNWEQLESLPGKFDVVTNSFGVSFIQNIDRFTESVISKINPGGMFAFTNFDDGGFPPLGQEFYNDLKRLSLFKKFPTQLSPANERLISLFEQHGFETLKNIKLELKYPFTNPEQWWTIITRTAIKENFFYDLTDEEINFLKGEHFKTVQKVMDEGRCDYLIVPIVIYIGRTK